MTMVSREDAGKITVRVEPFADGALMRVGLRYSGREVARQRTNTHDNYQLIVEVIRLARRHMEAVDDPAPEIPPASIDASAEEWCTARDGEPDQVLFDIACEGSPGWAMDIAERLRALGWAALPEPAEKREVSEPWATKVSRECLDLAEYWTTLAIGANVIARRRNPEWLPFAERCERLVGYARGAAALITAMAADWRGGDTARTLVPYHVLLQAEGLSVAGVEHEVTSAAVVRTFQMVRAWYDRGISQPLAPPPRAPAPAVAAGPVGSAPVLPTGPTDAFTGQDAGAGPPADTAPGAIPPAREVRIPTTVPVPPAPNPWAVLRGGGIVEGSHRKERWLCVASDPAYKGFDWTEDRQRALQFARERDAQAVASIFSANAPDARATMLFT